MTELVIRVMVMVSSTVRDRFRVRSKVRSRAKIRSSESTDQKN